MSKVTKCTKSKHRKLQKVEKPNVQARLGQVILIYECFFIPISQALYIYIQKKQLRCRFRLGKGQVRLGKVRLGQVRLGQGQVRDAWRRSMVRRTVEGWVQPMAQTQSLTVYVNRSCVVFAVLYFAVLYVSTFCICISSLSIQFSQLPCSMK